MPRLLSFVVMRPPHLYSMLFLQFVRFSSPDKLLVARDVNVFLLDRVEAASASLCLSDVTLERLGSSVTVWRMIVSIFLVFNVRK